MSLESHSAPGAAAAFEFQFERALYWLAHSPAGFAVGIETADDVTIRHHDGSLTLEQDKHSIREKGLPFGDRSKDLWNTLSIWVAALEQGELECEKVRFLMVTNKTLPDCMVKMISKAQSSEEIEECIIALEPAAAEPSESIRKLTEKVLAESSRSYLHTVIENCELVDGNDGASIEDLRRTAVAELQIPAGFANSTESIGNELRGWLSQQVLRLWHEQKPAWISREKPTEYQR